MKKGNDLRYLILAALIAALEIITVRLLPFTTFYLPPGTYIVRVSLQTIWYVLAGWIVGPGWAMGAAMTSDVIGAMINATGSGVFFPGYTITAALSGLAFGFILYKSTPTLWRTLLAVSVHTLLISLPLSAYWGSVTGIYPDFWTPFWAALPWRAMMILPYTLISFALQKALQKTVGKL